jgi:hypothetical protein
VGISVSALKDPAVHAKRHRGNFITDAGCNAAQRRPPPRRPADRRQPRGMHQQLNEPANLNDDIYIYATAVR